jgi:hypothetical protein
MKRRHLRSGPRVALSCVLLTGACGVERHFVFRDASAGNTQIRETDAGHQGDGSQPQAAALEDFTSGEWIFRGDRKWTGAPLRSPTEVLLEDDYAATTEPAMHLVIVSSEGATVTIGSKPMIGSRTHASTSTQLAFELGKGTFAGGRFVVGQGPKSLEAELTLYGSGVPIVESHRGTLVRAP